MYGRSLMGPRGRSFRDARLGAVDPGRTVASGEVWLGDLESVQDFFAQPVPPLHTPLTDAWPGGRRLTAETLSRVVDLGRKWLDRADARLAGRVGDDDDDRWKRPLGERIRNEDHYLSRERRANRDQITAINEANSKFWKEQQQPRSPTRDTAPPPASADARERVRSMNESARRFWGQRA
jgi:hypothetical protein